MIIIRFCNLAEYLQFWKAPLISLPSRTKDCSMQKVTSLDQSKNQNIFTTSGESGNNVYPLKKAVVLFILRQSLLESGSEAFDMVNRSLFEKYRCELSDCFEKPEYLLDVLKYVYDGSYTAVVESMKQSLEKFAQECIIKEFLEKIR